MYQQNFVCVSCTFLQNKFRFQCDDQLRGLSSKGILQGPRTHCIAYKTVKRKIKYFLSNQKQRAKNAWSQIVPVNNIRSKSQKQIT